MIKKQEAWARDWYYRTIEEQMDAKSLKEKVLAEIKLSPINAFIAGFETCLTFVLNEEWHNSDVLENMFSEELTEEPEVPKKVETFVCNDNS